MELEAGERLFGIGGEDAFIRQLDDLLPHGRTKLLDENEVPRVGHRNRSVRDRVTCIVNDSALNTRCNLLRRSRRGDDACNRR